MSQSDLITVFEKNENHSAAYDEVIAFYNDLAASSSYVSVEAMGQTDIGKPLHVVVIDKSQKFDAGEARADNKVICFINNGIHPGEPCGIDASMMFARDILSNIKALEKMIFVVIPVYNIGGALNRGSFSRANQFGPDAYGFRGNAKNLDLNRDFVKCDSKNAMWFNIIYNTWDPDIFIDTHTSNGADYQYTMTLIPTQRDKLAKPLADYLYDTMLPDLYERMASANWEMTPYVYSRKTPDDGIAAFLDLARYSSGYAAVHHAISFMPETHMLKPYPDRVRSTLAFLESTTAYVVDHASDLLDARNTARAWYSEQSEVTLNWSLDMSDKKMRTFKGFTHGYKKSEISGEDRLYYDNEQPYTKEIPHFERYEASLVLNKPMAYVIPQAYESVIHRLIWNGVQPRVVTKDTMIQVEVYYIEDYETSKRPFEGHYLHSDILIRSEMQSILVREGDYIIPVDQLAERYILETLEPQAPDSYFAWNFFDGVLMQKEYFSSYVFEDLAANLVSNDPQLALDLEAAKAKDSKLAEDSRAQLDFIYKHSPYYEDTHMRYPVYRIIEY